MIIRKANAKDKDDILAISSKIWDGEDFVPKVFDKWINEEKGEFTVIEESGKVVAFSKMSYHENDVYWLEGLRVHENYRGNGYAKKLTEYYLDLAYKNNYKKLRCAIYKQEYTHIIEKYNFNVIAKYDYLFKEKIKHYSLTENINLIEDEKVYEFIVNSEEYIKYYNKFTFDWSFLDINKDMVSKLIKRKEVFGITRNYKLEAIIIISNYLAKESSIFPVFVSGRNYYKELLKFALNKYANLKNPNYINFMCPDIPDLKKSALELGFENNRKYNLNIWVFEREI